MNWEGDLELVSNHAKYQHSMMFLHFLATHHRHCFACFTTFRSPAVAFQRVACMTLGPQPQRPSHALRTILGYSGLPRLPL